MAKRLTAKQRAEKEKKERLYEGGVSIARAANKEIERRQQKSLNKTLGTNKYSVNDQMAQTAAKEINRRNEKAQKFRDYQAGLKKKREEEVQKKTTYWKDLNKDATAAGHPEVSYAAKMINDTPAESNEEKRAKFNKFLGNIGLKTNKQPEQEQRSTLKPTVTVQPEEKTNGAIDYKGGLERYLSSRKGMTQQEANDYLGYNGYKDRIKQKEDEEGQPENADAFGRTTAAQFKADMQNTWGQRKYGMFDSGTDYMMMSDSGLQNRRDYWNNQSEMYRGFADEATKKYAVNPGDAMGDVFDVVEMHEWAKNDDRLNRSWSLAEMDARAKKNAEREATEEKRKAAVIERARDLMSDFAQRKDDYDYYLLTEQGREDELEGMRRWLYDSCFKDTYDERVAGMNEAEKKRLDDALDEVFKQVHDWDNQYIYDKYTSDMSDYLTQADAFESYAKQVDEEISRRSELGTLTQWANEWEERDGVVSNYDPSLIPEPVYSGTADSFELRPQGNWVEQAYYWANNEAPMGYGQTEKWYFMMPDELETFNTLFAHDKGNGSRGQMGSNTAEMFLKALEPYLTQRKATYDENFVRETSQIHVVGELARVATYPMNVVSGILGTAGAIAAKLGVESAKDKSSGWYLGTKFVSTTREQQNEDIAKWATEKFGDAAGQIAQDALGIIDSVVDNVMAKYTGFAFGGDMTNTVTKTMVQMIMSSEATSHTMLEKLETMDPDDAATYALVDGVLEWITEEMGWDVVFNPNIKELVGSNGQMALYLAKTFGAEGAEEISSKVLNSCFDYIHASLKGHESEAQKRYNQLRVEYNMSDAEAKHTALMEYVEEAMKEGLAGGIAGGISGTAYIYSNTINQIKTGADIQNREIGDVSAINQLLKTGKGLGAISKEAAGRIEEQLEQGLKVSNRDVGKLAQAAEIEAAEEGNVEALKSIAEIKGEETPQIVRDVVGEQMASEDDIRRAEGERTNTKTEVIVDGEYGDIVGVENGKYVVQTADGKKTVDASDIKATDFKTAAIIRQSSTNKGLYSDKFTNTLLEMQKQGDQTNTANLLQDAENIRLAAYLGQEKPTNVKISQEAANRIWMESLEEAGQQRRQNTGRGTFRGIGKGTVTLNGADFNTEEYNQNREKLSRKERAQVDFVANFARYSGIEMNIVNTEEMARITGNEEYAWGMHGQYDGGIVLNLDSRDTREDTGKRHNMVVTLGHETTHWLKDNSPSAYYALQDYVLKTMGRDGVNLQKLVRDKIANYQRAGKDIDINEAIDEIVANASDQVLGSREAAEYFQQEKPGVFKQIQNYVSDLVNRFREALAGMEDSRSWEAFLMGKHINELAKNWLGAYDEALSGQIREAEQGEKPEGKWSAADFSDLDEQYEEAVKSGDIQTATNMLLEKLENSEGITPFNAPEWYAGQHQDIAQMIKNGTPEAVARAAADMVQYVPDNAVLVPMPNHHGVVNDQTDTMILAKAISELTGRPVVAALQGAERGSRFAAKNDPKAKQVTAEEMGFRQVEELPEGTMPIFIDNVVGSGVTAQAANKALGGGITLAYAKSVRSKGIEGLKRIAVTYDNDGKLIPLSQRLNKNVRDTRYSMAQLDDQYMAAVKNGNMDEAQRLVDEYAARALKNSEVRYGDGELIKVFHGTESDFNVFETSNKNGGQHGVAEGYGIYLTDRQEISEKYGKRQIGAYLNCKRLALHNETTIKKNELVSLIKKTCEEQAKKMIDEEGYDSLQEAIQNSWISNYIYTLDYTNNNRMYSAVADLIMSQNSNDIDIIQEVMAGMAIRDYDAAMDFYHNILTPVTGFDGFWTEWKNYKNETTGNIFLAFDSSQIKSADPVTYDDDGNVIPLSERFNENKKDIRYSVAETQAARTVESVTNEDGEQTMEMLPGGTVSMYSLTSYLDDDDRGRMIRALKKTGLYTDEQIEKWIADLDSVARYIADNKDRLDFTPDRSQKYRKPNGDVYKWTLDASTLCAKRLLYQGTFNEIQKLLPNTPLRPGDLIDLVNMMHEMGKQTPCGICYVESRRRHTGNAIEKFLANYQGEYIPNYADLASTEGLAKLKQEHPQTYKDFIKAMNRRGAGSIKLVQLRTDYRGDLRRMGQKSIEYLNSIGGIRIQSFSDFETPHMLDLMQAVMDMKMKGLTSQAYTKVPAFAWVFGDTGIKINLSLMGDGTGVDEDGNLIFSNTEGMDFDEAMRLRDRYSKNVGTILVGMNKAHILAAMADDRIDFIIPFHRSGWSKEEFEKMTTLKGYDDFEAWQNERVITGENADGSPIYKVVKNIEPKEYWDEKLSGKENAEKYLKLCAKNGVVPKFNNFLVDNGNGSWSLQKDGSTDGYWKTLIDYKMYDNSGKFSPQTVVEPNFNMDEAMRVLQEYDGNPNELPVAKDVVDRYVKEYKEKHPLGNGKTQYSIAEQNMDVNAWMMGQTESSFQTESERALLKNYKGLKINIDMVQKRIRDYQEELQKLEKQKVQDADTRDRMTELKNKIQIKEDQLARYEDELQQITSTEGYAGWMYRNRMALENFVYGRTQEQVRQAVDQMTWAAKQAEDRISRREKELKQKADEAGVKTIRRAIAKRGLKGFVDVFTDQYKTSLTKDELESRLAEISLRQLNGENIDADVEALAYDVLNNLYGRGYEDAAEMLGELRGLRVTIDKAQQKDMKARNLTLADIREKTKGSGVTFEFGERNSLDEDANEIAQQMPSLRDKIGHDKDSLDNVVNYIANLMEQQKGEYNEYGADENELKTFIRAAANIIAMGTENDSSTADALRAAIRREMGEIGKQLEDIRTLKESAESIKEAGKRANMFTGEMESNIAEAIRYYNMTAKQAAEVERNRVRRDVIETLKSDHTKVLLKQQEEYEELIKKNKKAYQLKEDNESLRKQTTTVIKRIRDRLIGETDQKFIPEEAKPLARFLTGMLVRHDAAGLRNVLYYSSKEAQNDFLYRLDKMEATFGKFEPEEDLDWLVVKAPNPADNDYSLRDKVWQNLADIESALVKYRSAEGNGVVTLQDRNEALNKIQDAVSEIWDVIKARNEAIIEGHKWQVMELALMFNGDAQNSKYKGERTGKLGKAADTVEKAVGYGNLTPEYFFKNLKNRAMTLLHKGLQEAEQRSGLEAKRAQERIAKIAEETGFRTWDGQEKHTITANGRKIEITTEQLMALYATWLREKNALRPEDTAHLLHGGFVLAEDNSKGLYGRKQANNRPIRMSEDELNALENELTEKQKEYVDKIVAYMSGDLAELGNEASMKTYGIKKFTEQYYFPIKSWGGVLNKSSDSGVTNRNDNRAMRQSFTKRITANAQNAIEIGDFTPTAMKHIVGMINFNTVGPAVENLNKVLNQQLKEGEKTEDEDDTFKRNMRAVFAEKYGKNAYDYLERFMGDINGGVGRQNDTSLREKLLSIFKKNAVAGSLSVAAQQPLSYIRAAMMVNPKYLAQAISPQYWKGSYEEMMKYSGVAVIKAMGKFDMNYGRSMQDFITPEGIESKGKKIAGAISEAATSLPEKMDAMTWTRMWTACKLETKAKNPGMDVKNDAFLNKVAQRFNEVMRQTQVYDSVMVKSQNMRSNSYLKKVTTSFMAEPTLSLNVLADAWKNIGEKGGKAKAAKALAAFLLSAAAQAGAKAFFGTGRTPDKKKTQEENFLNKLGYNLIGEMNPISMIPGYSQLIDVLTDGELKDDAMGMLGKAVEVYDRIRDLASGNGSKGLYRDLEDTIGQLVQLGTNVPAKNIMRDFRAMVNFFSGGRAENITGDSYNLSRETSGDVLKYQFIDTLFSNDLIGLINKRLGEAGYETTSKAYYQRIHNARKAGNDRDANGMIEYLLMGKEVKEETLNQNLRALIKADEDISAEEKYNRQKELGLQKGSSFIFDEYEAGNLTREKAEELYKQENPNANGKDILKAFDKIDWEKDGKPLAKGQENYTNYTPLYVAIENNKADEIQKAVKYMTKNGYAAKDIKSQVNSQVKKLYQSADANGKIRLRDALTKTYKALGFTAEDAEKTISGWSK